MSTKELRAHASDMTKKSKKIKIGKEKAGTPYQGSIVMLIISRLVTILISLTVIYPVIFIFLTSFKDNMEFFSNIFGLPEVWRWENYVMAWVDGNIGAYAVNSVVVTITSVLLAVVLSAIAGYALSRMHIPKANLILGILVGLNFIPGVAIFISLYRQMITMGLSGTRWMLILPYAAWAIPFSIFIFKKFFDTIPQEIIEAARVDGSGELYTFLRVILPLVYPATATVIVFNFIGIWGEFMWANIASSASTEIITLPVGLLFFRGEFGIQWGPFAAAIVIIIVPLMAVFIYFQRYFIQGLTAGSVKG